MTPDYTCLDVVWANGAWHCASTLHPFFIFTVLALMVLLGWTLRGVMSNQPKKITEIEVLEEILAVDKQILAALSEEPILSSIKIHFGGNMAEGPVTLSVGQKTIASIDGFDQNGAPFTGTIPPVTFSIDSSGIASSTPNADGVTDTVAGVAAGVANLTATLTNSAGTVLTDTETVTVTAAAPVLSSIKINFSTPA